MTKMRFQWFWNGRVMMSPESAQSWCQSTSPPSCKCREWHFANRVNQLHTGLEHLMNKWNDTSMPASEHWGYKGGHGILSAQGDERDKTAFVLHAEGGFKNIVKDNKGFPTTPSMISYKSQVESNWTFLAKFHQMDKHPTTTTLLPDPTTIACINILWSCLTLLWFFCKKALFALKQMPLNGMK